MAVTPHSHPAERNVLGSPNNQSTQKGSQMTAAATTRRPGVVTFVGVLLYIKAFLAVIASAAAFYVLATDGASEAGLTDTDLWTAGIAEAVAFLILLLAASRLMSGSRGARTFVAVIIGIRLALVVWVMLTHHTGGFLWNGVIAAAMALFILWAMYGNDASEAYFGD